jgi:hypothetical protein
MEISGLKNTVYPTTKDKTNEQHPKTVPPIKLCLQSPYMLNAINNGMERKAGEGLIK